MINRDFFIREVTLRLFEGKLGAKPKATLHLMLDYWEQHFKKGDDRWLAYTFATAHHETDRTFGPIREYGRGKGHRYPPYYGRGLVQLTWNYNYKKMSDRIGGVDLVKNPDLALDLKYAVPIIFIGMREGIFTGKKYADYFSPTKANWVQARRIINGLDKAKSIAGYAQRYYAAISYTT